MPITSPRHANAPVLTALGSAIRRSRRARGISQEELAHRADIDRTYVSSLERCQYSATVDMIEKLARVLGVEAAELLRQP